MFAGYVVCERRKYEAVHTPKLYSGLLLVNPGENPALLITQIWRLPFVIKRPLAVNKFTTLYWKN